MRLFHPAKLVWLVALLVLALPACGRKNSSAPLENQRPVVEFSRAPSRSGDLYSYSYEMFWSGFDPDGEVREFLYAVDPPAPSAAVPQPDTAWVSTTLNRGDFRFDATGPLPPLPNTNPLAASYHTLVLKAVDNHGLASLPKVVAFNAATVAPSVRITSPAPSSRFRQFLPPAILIQWVGEDLDGIASRKPVHYRVKLLTASTTITPAMILLYPDTLIRYYQPRNWATWDSLGGDAVSYSFSALAPEQDYCFAIIAYDEAGAYTPYASRDANVLHFRTLYASAGGPIITMSNEFFTYTYPAGVYAPSDPRYEVRLEVPSGVPLTFNWSAVAQEGTDMRYYRWVLDPEDLLDERPRANERTDLSRWSQSTLFVTSCTLGPFLTAGDHRLYIEAGDGNGLKSLGVIRFQVVVGVFDKPLAIVDDTRLLVDRRSPGATTCIDRPLGRFPTAAELDTFLFARGGVPIRCYPAGSVSLQGVFWGYEFDTLNTRIGRTNLTPSLSLLSRYRHLIWLLNADGADNTNPGTDLGNGMTALRYINTVGNLNVLVAYVRQGGEIWFAGGGAASAAINPFNVSGNDRPSRTYSSAAGELRPGRFVYDVMHWRSEFKPAAGVLQVNRSLGRLASTPGSYAAFPATLNTKSLAAGDSLPAWRTNMGDFYLTAIDIETLTLPNPIVEDLDPSPDREDLVSVMDTLYSVSGGTLPPNTTIMTVYHGSENPRIIVTGFDLWSYQKVQLRQIVDAVLQGMWGMTRRSSPPN
ncbi:MAG: hypothetical protein ABIS67_01935 [Candidatus Eisenbacteria bacterium]